MEKSMKKCLKFLLMCVWVVAVAIAQPSYAQKSTAKKPATTQKKAVAKKPAAQKTVTQKKTTQKPKSKAKPAAKTTKPKAKTETYTNPNIKNLQNQRKEIQQKIRQQEQALKVNQADVKQRLQNLLSLNTAIDERQRNIDNIQKDMTSSMAIVSSPVSKRVLNS